MSTPIHHRPEGLQPLDSTEITDFTPPAQLKSASIASSISPDVSSPSTCSLGYADSPHSQLSPSSDDLQTTRLTTFNPNELSDKELKDVIKSLEEQHKVYVAQLTTLGKAIKPEKEKLTRSIDQAKKDRIIEIELRILETQLEDLLKPLEALQKAKMNINESVRAIKKEIDTRSKKTQIKPEVSGIISRSTEFLSSKRLTDAFRFDLPPCDIANMLYPYDLKPKVIEQLSDLNSDPKYTNPELLKNALHKILGATVIETILTTTFMRYLEFVINQQIEKNIPSHFDKQQYLPQVLLFRGIRPFTSKGSVHGTSEIDAIILIRQLDGSYQRLVLSIKSDLSKAKIGDEFHALLKWITDGGEELDLTLAKNPFYLQVRAPMPGDKDESNHCFLPDKVFPLRQMLLQDLKAGTAFELPWAAIGLGQQGGVIKQQLEPCRFYGPTLLNILIALANYKELYPILLPMIKTLSPSLDLGELGSPSGAKRDLTQESAICAQPLISLSSNLKRFLSEGRVPESSHLDQDFLKQIAVQHLALFKAKGEATTQNCLALAESLSLIICSGLHQHPTIAQRMHGLIAVRTMDAQLASSRCTAILPAQAKTAPLEARITHQLEQGADAVFTIRQPSDDRASDITVTTHASRSRFGQENAPPAETVTKPKTPIRDAKTPKASTPPLATRKTQPIVYLSPQYSARGGNPMPTTTLGQAPRGILFAR